MLYLDYAKPLTGGKYILNLFAESIEDLNSISHGQRFITKNGADYGVPQPSSTVVITMPDKTKKTYVLNEAGEWQEGGVDMDYSKLENAPIILANLADKEFIPEANTYYEHLGETTEDFIKGIIYLYDGKEYKAIDGSGSGAGVQSDYNQNDSAAADYIKNRPFYEETKTGLAEVFNETLAFEWDTEANAGSSVSEFAGASMKGVAVGESVIVIFNGVEYNLTTQELPDEFKGEIEAVGGAGFLVGAAWPTSESWTPPENLPFSLVCAWASIDGQEITVVYGVTTINQVSIPVIIKVKATVTEIHTIDPKFIKDMYYSTEAFSPLIDFKVISGDINTIGSTMVVQYDGKEYTEIVKDAAEQGSSEHKPYIGFKMGGTPTPTEEQPFCYGVNIMLDSNAKELYCAAPKTVSENEVIIYNGESKTVKKMTVGSISFLYVGNLHLFNTDFEDTGEQYLTLFDFVSILTQGELDLVASVVPQDGILCGVKSENISYINPKYIKDMYHEETGDTILQIVSGTYTGEDLVEGIASIIFPVTALLVVDKPATIKTSQGLEETQVVKSGKVGSQAIPYIGNLSLIDGGAPNTGETYVFYTVESDGLLIGGFVQTTPFTDMKIEVSQFGIGETIVKMPLKYLPDEAATKSDVAKAIAEAITTTLNTDV